jgi:hypothetical protein
MRVRVQKLFAHVLDQAPLQSFNALIDRFGSQQDPAGRSTLLASFLGSLSGRSCLPGRPSRTCGCRKTATRRYAAGGDQPHRRPVPDLPGVGTIPFSKKAATGTFRVRA